MDSSQGPWGDNVARKASELSSHAFATIFGWNCQGPQLTDWEEGRGEGHQGPRVRLRRETLPTPRCPAFVHQSCRRSPEERGWSTAALPMATAAGAGWRPLSDGQLVGRKSPVSSVASASSLGTTNVEERQTCHLACKLVKGTSHNLLLGSLLLRMWRNLGV